MAFFASPIVGALIIGDAGLGRVPVATALTATMLGLGVLVALTLRELAPEWKVERPDALTIFRSGLKNLRTHAALRNITWATVLTTPFTALGC